jgi:hypothetical protein
MRTTFASGLDSVRQLLEFDRVIIDEAIASLNAFAETQNHQTEVAVKNKVASIRNIRNSDSLRPRYALMHNQCVVLLVSYFSAAMDDIFRAAVREALRRQVSVPVAAIDVKLAYRDVANTNETLETVITEAFIAQKDVSFQDMKSIVRVFKESLDIDLPRSAQMDDVILGQAARHAIVHAAARVDARMIKQVAGATSRTLKQQLNQDQTIQFSPIEVIHLGQSMRELIAETLQRLQKPFQATRENGELRRAEA